MTTVILAAAAALLGHFVSSRSRREQRHALARAARRSARERQWRAMIRDAGGDDRHR